MTHMGVLRGLKAVERNKLFLIKTYALPGTTKNFLVNNPIEAETFEAGVDVRYGVTANLALDMSYNTDFAQVEGDQEQVNLTQFSLFFPEKREFFLEGASLFDFGEAATLTGGDNRPPTLLFYSRRIGLEGGQPVPILLGSKLTGKSGRTSIGAMHVMTDSEGLDDVSDFTVFRIKRDVFARSNVGFIVVNKQTDDIGDLNPYNRAGGVDFSFSPTRLFNIQGFYARTWDKDIGDTDDARFIRMDYNGGKMRANFSYIDVEDNFEPDVGFVNRRRGLRAFKRYNSTLFHVPRPRVANIRNLRYGPSFQVVTDPDNNVQFWRTRFDGVIAFQSADRILARVDRTRDVVPANFRPVRRRSDLVISPGDYTFTNFRIGPSTAGYRTWQLGLDMEVGTFYTGKRYRIQMEGTYRPSGRFTIESTYDANWIRLPPNKKASVKALSTRFLYSFTTDFFVKLFTQWNNDSQSVTGNFLLNYRYRPGSDIFLVFDQGYGTETGDLTKSNRTVLLKVSYLMGI